jgi:hypothetical protein
MIFSMTLTKNESNSMGSFEKGETIHPCPNFMEKHHGNTKKKYGAFL